MKIDNVLELVRDNIRSLSPYSTARDEYSGEIGVFLDANESPYENGYNRYPDPTQARLKSLIGEIKGVAPQRMFIGNGSDEAIDLCFRIFCTPGVDSAIAIAPSYGMYKVSAAINDVRMCEVPLGEEFTLPVEQLLEADKSAKLMFICSPNNPTGNSFPREDMERLLRDFAGVVVIDEAYIDFAEQASMLNLLDECPNLIVLQTMSKAWGMAGLRMGLAFASEQIMSIFAQVKYPYNINTSGMQMAERLLTEPVAQHVAEVVAERRRVVEALQACEAVVRVYASDANFVLVRVTDARGLYDRLLTEGVIVRDRSKVLLCEQSLRITIGTKSENDKMLQVVKEYRA